MPARRARRRDFLVATACALAVPLLPRPAFADSPTDMKLHGLSAFGDLKYPAGLRAFRLCQSGRAEGRHVQLPPPNWIYNQDTSTFNTLNSFVAKGDAPPRMELCLRLADGQRTR